MEDDLVGDGSDMDKFGGRGFREGGVVEVADAFSAELGRFCELE